MRSREEGNDAHRKERLGRRDVDSHDQSHSEPARQDEQAQRKLPFGVALAAEPPWEGACGRPGRSLRHHGVRDGHRRDPSEGKRQEEKKRERSLDGPVDRKKGETEGDGAMDVRGPFPPIGRGRRDEH